ncbi:MAG: glycosyltransferase family 39 protein [Chloroflexi bacterium]|nr:glycosyltransferase family 39 protein [Chloroflexota bacterium]
MRTVQTLPQPAAAIADRRRRLLAFGAWSATAVWIGWVGWIAIVFRWGEDVPWFWAAARAILHGANPYVQAEQLPFFPAMPEVGQHAFLYLPWVGLAFVPFALLAADAARLLWVLGSLALVVLTTLWLTRLMDSPADRRPFASAWSWQRAVLVAGSVWLGLACLRAGQFGVLLLAGLALLLHSDRSGRGWLAGPAALLLSFKPQITFAVLGAVLLEAVLRRRRQELRALVIAIAGAALASTVVLPTWWRDYLAVDFASGRYATTVEGGRLIYGTASADAWLRAVLGVEGSSATALWTVFGAAFVLIAGRLWWQAATGRGPRSLALAAATCAGLLLTPYARQYDYAVLALPLVAIWSAPAARRQIVVRWAALAGLFVLAALGGDIAQAYWIPLVLFGLVVLAVVAGGRREAIEEILVTTATKLRGVDARFRVFSRRFAAFVVQTSPLGLVLLGGALRLADLGGPSYWYDEAASALIAALPPDRIIAATAADTLPPLYYLLLHLWQVWLALGNGELILRWPSVAFGTLSLAILYTLGRRLVGRTAATIGLALAALAPFAIYYAREVRQYSLLGFLLVLATWLAWEVWHGASWRSAAGLAVTAGAALYVHVFAGLTLLVLAGFALFAPGRLDRRRWHVVGALAVGLLLFAPWLAILPRQVALVETSFWVDRPSILAPVASLYTFVFAHTLSGWLLPLGIGWLLLVLSLAALRTWRGRRGLDHGLNTPAGVLLPAVNGGSLNWKPGPPFTAAALPAYSGLGLLAVLLVFPPLLALAISLVRPVYLDRTLVGAAWPLYLLLGWGLAWLPRPLGLALCGAGLTLLAVGLLGFYLAPALAKPPLRAAAAIVTAGWQPGDRVFHTSDGSYYPFQLYGVGGHLVAGDPEYVRGGVRGTFSRLLGTVSVDLAAVSATGGAWLVLLADHSVSWQWQQKVLLDDRFGAPIAADVGGIKVFRYGGRR